MGVHVILDIDPNGIDPDAWAAAYDETLALLESWRPRLLGWGIRSFEGSRVPVYARSVRDGHTPDDLGWSVVGDRGSMQTAECQSLHRDLAHYTRRLRDEPSHEDIVVAAADPKNEYVCGPVRVFGDKTQGHPYHFAVLAAAMLIEERFPGRAMVRGDIDRGQAEEARRMAVSILGRALTLPVCVDAARLVERLRTRCDDEALPRAFRRVFLAEGDEEHEAVLREFPGTLGAREWLRGFEGNKDPSSIGVVRLLVDWLNAGRDVRDACRLLCEAPEGPGFSPEGFVDALAGTWVAIPRWVREPLDAFRRPRGAPHTVWSLFGSVLLDMEATGRHLRVYIEPATLEAALSEVFGERGPALGARLVDQSAKLEARLREQADRVRNLVAQANARVDDDTESLAAGCSVDAMGEHQRTWVRGMAWSVARGIATVREDPRVAEVLADAKKAKGLIVRMLADRGPTLTEDAWDSVVAESDIGVLVWWAVLLTLDASEIHASQVRRAFFENAELRRYAMAIGRDEREMLAVGELVAKARAQKKAA